MLHLMEFIHNFTYKFGILYNLCCLYCEVVFFAVYGGAQVLVHTSIHKVNIKIRRSLKSELYVHKGELCDRFIASLKKRV